MQKKLNEDFIESYSEQFAAKISDDFFASKPFINGQEILSVTPSKQVNFFIIKLLFNNWQQESQRLESPFFDYTAPEVKEAMLQFMNVLSRHIKVSRKEFEILLQDAVRDTLFLIMAPNAYMEIEMDRRGTEELTEKTAKNILKYLKICKEEFSEYLMDNIGLDRDEIDIYDGIISEDLLLAEIDVLNEIQPITLKLLEEGDEEEDVDEELDRSDDDEDILNVEPEDVFKSTIDPTSEVQSENLSEEELEIGHTDNDGLEVVEEVVESPVEFVTDNLDESPEIDESDTPEDTDDDQPDHQIEENEIDEDLIPEGDSPIEESEEEFNDEIEDKEEELVDELEENEKKVSVSNWEISDKVEEVSDEEELDEEELTDDISPKSKEIITNIDPDDEDEEDDEDSLNARFEDPTSPASIAEAHENQVDSMMNAISLNQRFMFINELFDGDPEVFKESVDMVDECGSFDESVEKLVQNYARDYHWDMNSEEVKELLKIIFRRFR